MANIKLLCPEPTIKFTIEAFLKQQTLIQIAPAEVTWLGVVEKIDNLYIVQDIIIPKQEVSSTSCEIDPEDLVSYAHLSEKIRFWGHSHANMGVTPSYTDQQTMNLFSDSCSYFIRYVANKRNEYSLDFFDYQRLIVIEGLKYQIISDEIRKEVEIEFKEKVKEKVYKPIYLGLHNYSYDSGYEKIGDETYELTELTSKRKKKK